MSDDDGDDDGGKVGLHAGDHHGDTLARGDTPGEQRPWGHCPGAGDVVFLTLLLTCILPGQLSGHLQEPHVQERDGPPLGQVSGILKYLF